MYKKLYARVLESYGLSDKKHLPDEGRDAWHIAYDGVKPPFSVVRVWIRPFVQMNRNLHNTDAPRHLRRRRMQMRVMAKCPACKQTISAGRYEQHIARRDHQQQEVANANA